MIPARYAAAIVAGAGWHGLALLAGRADGAGLATTLTLVVLLAWALRRASHWVSDLRSLMALAAIVAAAATGIALPQIAAVVFALTLCALPRPRPPLMALALLAVPMLPTLDMLLAWPLRRVSAFITVALLRLNGIGVGLEGVAIEWHGRQLLFDGPCSGVRMLWAMLVLACLIAGIRRLPLTRFLLLLGAATGVAVIGNALRAASLFYLESGFVPALTSPAVHEAVGLAAFALVGGGTLALLARRKIAA